MPRVLMSVVALVAPAFAYAAAPGSLTVRSSAFSEGGTIPSEYSCDGKGALPPIEWSDVPMGTKSIVVMVDDPDAPGRTYAHWLVYNLPPSTRSLSDAGLPEGAETGLNDAGERAFKPICPGSPGEHHYRFKVFAVDIALPSLVQSSERDVMTSMGNHVMAEGQLTASYAKQGLGAAPGAPETPAMPSPDRLPPTATPPGPTTTPPLSTPNTPRSTPPATPDDPRMPPSLPLPPKAPPESQ